MAGNSHHKHSCTISSPDMKDKHSSVRTPGRATEVCLCGEQIQTVLLAFPKHCVWRCGKQVPSSQPLSLALSEISRNIHFKQLLDERQSLPARREPVCVQQTHALNINATARMLQEAGPIRERLGWVMEEGNRQTHSLHHRDSSKHPRVH
jgi:hypothetical protein